MVKLQVFDGQSPIERARDYARSFRALGYNPIPSRTDRKGPACQDYAVYRDGQPIPDKWLDRWWTPNIQLATGTAWHLLVVDIDGDLARAEWSSLLARRPPLEPTWQVRSGGGGLHLYFTLPSWLPSFPSRSIWGQWDPVNHKWEKHQFIELIADGKLIIAPPSVHVRTGVPYRYLDGFGPYEISRPAPAPDWLLWMPGVVAPVPRPQPIRSSPMARVCSSRRRFQHRDVALAVSAAEKLNTVRSWGLRVVRDQPNPNGWVPCHAWDREDVHPSASFNVITGYYKDHGTGIRMSLFDLGVALGQFRTWIDTMVYFGEGRYTRHLANVHCRAA